MRCLIVLALIGTALAAPRSPSQNRIVGGSETNVETYPFMANMQYHWFGVVWVQYCGGSLLTSTVVVSAAHCYEGDRPTNWNVVLGTSHEDGIDGGIRHVVSDLLPHANYNAATLVADIAIIRLAIPATYSDKIQPVAIAGSNYNLADNSVVTAIGWGALSSGGQYPVMLQHVDINVINQEICAERYLELKSQSGNSHWPDITADMLCAGILDVGGKDACQGDSGGPLVHGDVLVGVTSWGYGCAHATYPGVNSRVSYYSNWIVSNASS